MAERQKSLSEVSAHGVAKITVPGGKALNRKGPLGVNSAVRGYADARCSQYGGRVGVCIVHVGHVDRNCRIGDSRSCIRQLKVSVRIAIIAG